MENIHHCVNFNQNHVQIFIRLKVLGLDGVSCQTSNNATLKTEESTIHSFKSASQHYRHYSHMQITRAHTHLQIFSLIVWQY